MKVDAINHVAVHNQEELEREKSMKAAQWLYRHLPPGNLFMRPKRKSRPNPKEQDEEEDAADLRIESTVRHKQEDFDAFLKVWHSSRQSDLGSVSSALRKGLLGQNKIDFKSTPTARHGTLPRHISLLNVPESGSDVVITYLRLLLGCKSCSCK